jgi:hypothetical protein
MFRPLTEASDLELDQAAQITSADLSRARRNYPRHQKVRPYRELPEATAEADDDRTTR